MDPTWVTVETLEQWDANNVVVYLCGVVDGVWSVRIAAPSSSDTGVSQPDLLDRFDPAGPIDGCFDLDEGRRALLTDGRSVFETTDISCDMGSLIQEG